MADDYVLKHDQLPEDPEDGQIFSCSRCDYRAQAVVEEGHRAQWVTVMERSRDE